VLKEVQEPLDIARGIELLRSVLTHYPQSPAALKAAEELIPLLIWQGRSSEARDVASTLLRLKPPGGIAYGASKDAAQSVQLGSFWLAYLAERQKRTGAEQLAAITAAYYGYYEVCSGARPGADFSDLHLAMLRPESPAEYLAGMALTDEARDWAADELRQPGAIEQYCEMRFDAEAKPLYVSQFEATAMLESGTLATCRESALLSFALAKAFPTPHLDEARSACAKAGVPLALLYAVIKKESGFREGAQSGAGAQGLMQVMPGTVRFLIDARTCRRTTFSAAMNPL
jgi:hypothetical protein